MSTSNNGSGGLKVVVDDTPIDHSYFRASDIRPVVTADNRLIIQDWRGTRRAWGSPSVRSVVESLSDSVVRVQVVGWHKHTVSPVGGAYYFVRSSSGVWTRTTKANSVVRSALAEMEAKHNVD